MYFFTSDEHYDHKNILAYCDRPFASVDEMNREIAARHNAVVRDGDTVIHAGDFCWRKEPKEYINRLNGSHIFLRGSHDQWLSKTALTLWEGRIGDLYVVVCHYAMRTWPRSHHGSIQLYGHSHGKLEPLGRQYDIGVDNNDFYPVSGDFIEEMFSAAPEASKEE